MILTARPTELADTSILRIKRQVQERTGGRIRNLRICIMNEEEIVLHGRSDNHYIKQLAQVGAAEAAPGVKVHNTIEVF